MPFRTTELSTPEHESGHLRFITIKTPNLKGRGDICVFVPPGQFDQPLPIVTLLHGVYGSCWAWSQSAGVHHTALRMIASGKIPPMVLAMPSDGLWGDGSLYLPHHDRNYESWIVDDVPQALIENIPQVSADSPRFIAGLSMGGYGALRLGAKYAERYDAIAGHSSVTESIQLRQFMEEDPQDYLDSSQTDQARLQDVFAENQTKLPPIRFDCGTDDSLIVPNRELHAFLGSKGIAHEYAEHPGGHEWPYWAKHIQSTLRFFAKHC